MSPVGGGRGRPAKLPEERASRFLRLRCTAADLELYQTAADRAGLSLSAWVRLTLAASASEVSVSSSSVYKTD